MPVCWSESKSESAARTCQSDNHWQAEDLRLITLSDSERRLAVSVRLNHLQSKSLQSKSLLLLVVVIAVRVAPTD